MVEKSLSIGANATACAGALVAIWALFYPGKAADYIATFQELIEQSAADVTRIADNSDEVRDNTSIIAGDVRNWLETSLQAYENDGKFEVSVQTWNNTNRPIRAIEVFAILDGRPVVSGKTVLQPMAYEVIEADGLLTLPQTGELAICVRGVVEGAVNPTYEIQVYPISNGTIGNRIQHETTDAPLVPCRD